MSYASRYRLTKAGKLRREREKRCQGRWHEYIPWILVHEISSMGWSTRAWSDKMQRIVHLLSRLEYLFFLRLEFSPRVVEFYEQFALPFEAAKAIAEMKGFTYPRDPVTKEEIVMTSDFIINTSDGKLDVRSIKPKEELERDRVRQKLMIEQVLWTEIERADSWKTISRDQMCPALDANIAWVWRLRSPARLSSEATPHVDHARALARALLLDQAYTLAKTSEIMGHEFRNRGVGTELLRHLLASGAFPETDFSVRFNLDRQLPLLASRRTHAASS